MFSVDEDGSGSRTESSAKWENQSFFLPSPTQMADDVSRKVTISAVDVIIPMKCPIYAYLVRFSRWRCGTRIGTNKIAFLVVYIFRLSRCSSCIPGNSPFQCKRIRCLKMFSLTFCINVDIKL